MRPDDVAITHGNLSLAWAEAFLRVWQAPGGELPQPLVLSIDEFIDGDPAEHPDIRAALDQAIVRANAGHTKRRVQTVSATASTIFPRMCWSPRQPRSADDLFDRYLNGILPRLKKLSGLNSRGTYFSRMIDATGLHGPKQEPKRVNQLREILEWWKRDKGHTRRSALQVGIYDPAKDHTGAARSVFPCLQQVSFGYRKKKLSLSAYYPTEYILDRGYGNYLGLCHLGDFMAHEMELELERVNVFIGLPELGSLGKGTLASLAAQLKTILTQIGNTGGGRATQHDR